jgi:HAD superfamily hydrolase (TIGR01509 family)
MAGSAGAGRASAVLFDLDATLFDHRRCTCAGLVALQESFECIRFWPLQELEALYGALLEEVHVCVLRGELTRCEARRVRMARLLMAVGEVDDVADEMADCYHDAYIAARAAVPGACELLRALHPLAMIGIVTNNLLAEQQAKLEVCGLSPLVDEVVASHDVGCAKPDPRIFGIALERLGVEPSRAVMVGDSWTADVLGARAAGIAAVWFNPLRIPCPDQAPVPQLHGYAPLEDALALLLRGEVAPCVTSVRPNRVAQ